MMAVLQTFVLLMVTLIVCLSLTAHTYPYGAFWVIGDTCAGVELHPTMGVFTNVDCR